MSPALIEALSAPPSKQAWSHVVAALETCLLAGDDEAAGRAFDASFECISRWPSGLASPMPTRHLAAWIEGDHRYTPIAELCYLSASKVAQAARKPLRNCTYYRVTHHLDRWRSNAEDPEIVEVTLCTSRVETVRAYLQGALRPSLELGQGHLAANLFCPPSYHNWLHRSPDRIDLLVNGKVIRSLFAFPDLTLREGVRVVRVQMPAPIDRDRVRRDARGKVSVRGASGSSSSLSSCTLLDGDDDVIHRGPLSALRAHPLWQPFRDAVPEHALEAVSLDEVQRSLPPLRARNGLPSDIASEGPFAPGDPFRHLRL